MGDTQWSFKLSDLARSLLDLDSRPTTGGNRFGSNTYVPLYRYFTGGFYKGWKDTRKINHGLLSQGTGDFRVTTRMTEQYGAQDFLFDSGITAQLRATTASMRWQLITIDENKSRDD